MAFVDLQNFSTAPAKIARPPRGNILDAFPAKDIDPHSRLGYSFRGEPCNDVEDYDPDICVFPSDAKMTPSEYGEAPKQASLRVLQSAFKCSTVGATDAELRQYARSAIERNLWRSVDNTLVDLLGAEDAPQFGGAGFTAREVLALGSQYLAVNSFAGTGVMFGPTSWVAMLSDDLDFENGRFEDEFGNIIIPHSVGGSDIVWVFDSEVEIRTSDITLLDEFAPGIRSVNDRVVRAEILYTLAVDNCTVASYTFAGFAPTP